MALKKEDCFYGLLTVKLMNPPGDEAAQYRHIKQALGLSDPQIDDDLGVVPQHMNKWDSEGLAPGEKIFVVGVEANTIRQLEQSGHPNVVGVRHALGYRGGHPPLGLKGPAGANKLPKYKKPKGPTP